jgi:COP9 signalosome complex subunit 5
MSTVPSVTASSRDQIFAYDAEHIQVLENNRPWLTDPKHFRHVKISAIASMKMV